MLIRVKDVEISTDRISSITIRENREERNVDLVICFSDTDENLIIKFDGLDETNEFFDQLI